MLKQREYSMKLVNNIALLLSLIYLTIMTEELALGKEGDYRIVENLRICEEAEARYTPPRTITICKNTTYNKEMLLEHEKRHAQWKLEMTRKERERWTEENPEEPCEHTEEYCRYYNRPEERYARATQEEYKREENTSK